MPRSTALTLSDAARPRYLYKSLGIPASQLSNTQAIKREAVLSNFMDGKREPPFTFVRRLQFTDPYKCTEWDALDNCHVCRVDVVYDSRYSHGRPHVCFRCAAHWALAGMPELRDLTGQASFDDGTDEEMYARLQLNLAANKRGALAVPRRQENNERSLKSSRFNTGDDGGNYDVATFRPRSKPSLLG